MKIILSIALLVTGVAGNAFVFGQNLPAPRLAPVLNFPKIQLSPYTRPTLKPDQELIVIDKKKPVAVLYSQARITGDDSIRIMRPDHMPCLVSNLSRVERMPVSKTKNSELMPTRIPK